MTPPYASNDDSDWFLMKDSTARTNPLCNVVQTVPLGVRRDHIADAKDETAPAAMASQ
jgi:hypothetical protein